MKFLILLIFQFSPTDTLPNDSLLFASIDSLCFQQLQSELSEFQESQPPNWMNFVPSIGIGYTPSGAPRPTVSYSISQLFQVKQRKLELSQKRKAIIQANQISCEIQKSKLRALLLQLEILNDELSQSLEIHELDEQLFRYYERQHQEAPDQLTPIEFLQKQRDWRLKEQAISDKVRAIRLKEIEILELTNL